MSSHKKICIIAVIGLVTLLLLCILSSARFMRPSAGTIGEVSTPAGEYMSVSVKARMRLETYSIHRYILFVCGAPTFVIIVDITVNITAENVENFSITILINFKHNLVGEKELGVLQRQVSSPGVYNFHFIITAKGFVDKVFGGFDPSWNDTIGNMTIDTWVDGWGVYSRRVLTVEAETEIMMSLTYKKEWIKLKLFTFSIFTVLFAVAVSLYKKEAEPTIHP